MPVHDQGMRDAVWLLLEITAQHQPGQIIHSDFVVRKFPKANEQELINTVGALAAEGKLTLKAASVDAHGNATSYHIRVRGYEDMPPSSPPEPRGQFNVGFGDTKAASSAPSGSTPPAKKVGLEIEGGTINITPDTGGVKPQAAPTREADSRPHSIPMGTGRIVTNTAQQDAEQQFADEVASFFAELASAPVAREEDKRELIDQLAVLMAMFQSADSESFTTPMAKLAMLKAKVHQVAPELAPDYLLLVQTAVRAWLGRV